NVDTSYDGVDQISLADNPDGGELGGTLTRTATGGVATFTGLTLDQAATGYQLQASAGGLPPATTNTFDVAAGTPTVPPAPPATLVGVPQFAVGSDVGGPATVTEYNPDGSVANTFNPFPGTTGGLRTAVADFNGDGTPDVAVGTGPGVTAEVKILDGKTGV